MGQRSRKRGQRAKATVAPRPPVSRSEQRNAEVRATLKPYAPGERPWSIKIGALVAFLLGGVQLVLFLAGVKLKVAHTRASAGQTIVFGILMFVCAGGVWLMRYWAVLGLMTLLGLLLVAFSLALIKASSLLGLAITLTGLVLGGLLFYRLVRVLSRIQMPRYPGR